MKITFTLPTEQDCIDMGGISLDGRIKLTAVDGDKTAYTYIKIEDHNRLGIEYISKNIRLEYSSFCDQWFIKIPENNYYNDTTRNPEKTIELNLISTYAGTGAELYRDIESGKYWLRYVSSREDFAKWLVCGVREPQNDDGNEPRPNITLKHKDQTEKLTYRDWNGTCAYSDTFNRNFNKITKENNTMTNAIIKIILTYSEYLRRVEAYHLNRAAHASNVAKIAYIHHRIDAITAERQALDAMVRVYIARTHMQPRARKTA